MHKEDIEAIGEAAGDALAGAGAVMAELHQGIACRPFDALGPRAETARAMHDEISRTVYASLQTAVRVAARTAANTVALAADDSTPRVADTPVGGRVLSALNGLYGDALDERGNGLALDMEVRSGGVAVAPTPDGIASAFPGAGARTVIFFHGLCESEESWRYRGAGADPHLQPTYGARLQRELGYTPIYLRYNTGRHVSHNGRDAARLIQELFDCWPVPVEEIVLVGHSMGGLVARSACHYAELDQRPWTRSVRHVFSLGTPNLGADLEKGANALGWVFGRVPETRALGTLLNARSTGIKDLRYGAVVDEDWRGHDPDELLRDRCNEVPFLPHASYYFVSAQITDGPLGTLVGDLLVRTPSASGRGIGTSRMIEFAPGDGHAVSGRHHFQLLNDPAVYEQMRIWLAREPAGTPATRAARRSVRHRRSRRTG